MCLDGTRLPPLMEDAHHLPSLLPDGSLVEGCVPVCTSDIRSLIAKWWPYSFMRQMYTMSKFIHIRLTLIFYVYHLRAC